MAMVHLAADFPMPAEVVTEAMAVMGRRGAGKTYAAGKLFEEMFSLGAQCVVLDPVGNWYGLRLARSGGRSGLDIPVFGGEHGDIPLEVEAGALIARVVVERSLSAVIDVSDFRKGQMKRFATEFAEELYQRQKRARSPMHLFIEEARVFIPQRLFGDQDPRMVGAFEDIVRRGRNYGIGCTLIDQRPQSVNKEVLSQVEILIAMQMTDKLGRKEIEDWVRQKEVSGAEALAQLAQLQPGEAFVWSPGFLKTFVKIKVGKKKTYDGSATPKFGVSSRFEPRPLNDDDLAQLREVMKETVERVEAGNPKKMVALLTRQRDVIRNQEGQLAVLNDELKKVKPAIGGSDLNRLERLLVKVDKQRDAMAQALQAFVSELGNVRTVLSQPGSSGNGAPATEDGQGHWKRLHIPIARATGKSTDLLTRHIIYGTASETKRAEEGLTGPEQRIIDALCWFEVINIPAPSVVAVAFLAGYKPNGGAFGNPKSRLKGKGLIQYAGKTLTLTPAGRALARAPEAMPTTEALHQAVLGRLRGPEKRLLRPLLDSYPHSLYLTELAAKAGYEAKGGAFGNPRSRLHTLGLVTYPKSGVVRASDILFPNI